MKTIDLQSSILFRLSSNANQLAHKFGDSYYVRRVELSTSTDVRSIHTHMTQRELTTLLVLASSLKKSPKVMEIGSYLGASSCYLATAVMAEQGCLFCVDTWENQTMSEGERDTFQEFKQNVGSVSEYIVPIRKNSKDLLYSDFACPLDLVFIDGDHSYSGVKNDFEKVAPWIVDGGILAFHDCVHFAGVSKTIGEALVEGYWQIGGHVDNLFWMRKVEKGHQGFTHTLM